MKSQLGKRLQGTHATASSSGCNNASSDLPAAVSQNNELADCILAVLPPQGAGEGGRRREEGN